MTNLSSQTLGKLEEWVQKEAHPSSLLDFYKRLLHLQAELEERITIAKLELSKRAALNHLARHKPLLRFDDVIANWPLIVDTFNKIVALFANYPDLFGRIPPALLEEKRRQKLTKRMARSWFEGKSLPTTVDGTKINPYLLDSLIHQSLRPFIIRYSRALISPVKCDLWRRGSCFNCGGQPDIGYLEKEVGARWLMCSRCDTEWHFQRLECPYCSNQDPTSLSCFSDDDDVYRLYICDKCRKYLKVIDLRNTKKEVLLQLERILTLDMDRQGQEKGYYPGYLNIEN